MIGREELPVQIVVICGYNQTLLEKVKKLKVKTGLSIHEFGFIENMHEFMDAADILVSKSGGISVTEALAKELPMRIVSPIPGQESRNCDFLVENGAAVRIKELDNVTKLLRDFMEHPEKFDEIKKRVRRVRRPNALFDIAYYAIDRIRP